MKNIEESFSRSLQGKLPLKSKKWNGVIIEEQGETLFVLLHYHHIILIYNIKEDNILFKWNETESDKAGLKYAIRYINDFKVFKNQEIKPLKDFNIIKFNNGLSLIKLITKKV